MTPAIYPHEKRQIQQLNEIKGDYYFWCTLTGIKIMDPDGWDRSNPECLKEPITLGEF